MHALQRMIHPDLLHGGIIRSLVFFAIPLLVSALFQQLYNACDIVIIGHFLGEESLAAIGACTSLYELLIGFGLGFGNGLGIVAARAFGAGDYAKLRRITVASCVITLFVTLFIMGGSWLWLERILVALGTPESIRAEAYSYIGVITLCCGVLFAYNLFSGLLRAIGNSFTPLLFLMFSSVLNIVADVVCITRFSLGIRGAAIATVFAQGVSALLCLGYLLVSARVLIPEKKSFRVERALYRELFAQGFSMAVMGAIVHTGTVILQYAINSFGTFVVAGHVCARKLYTFTSIPIMTLGLANATFVSQNLGAWQRDRIKKGVRCSELIILGWAVLLMAVLPFCLTHLVAFISGSTNMEIVGYARTYLLVTVPFYPILGVLIVTRNALQGLGSKLLPLISSIIEFIGKICFTLFLIPRLGTIGVILCEPVLWCVMTLQLVVVYVRHPVFSASASFNRL